MKKMTTKKQSKREEMEFIVFINLDRIIWVPSDQKRYQNCKMIDSCGNFWFRIEDFYKLGKLRKIIIKILLLTLKK